jgi:hypothetical protein
MNLNSRLFDSIRVKPAAKQQQEAAPAEIRCDYPGCTREGAFRAPMGRDREGQYFCFCLDHVREYNATYNYFDGMTDDAVAKYQKEAIVGHRPTWNMGVNRAGKGHREDGVDPAEDPLGMFRGRTGFHGAASPRRPLYSDATMKALAKLDLDDAATFDVVKARYKELVKRLHPDANGGDRSSEDKLREIIRAYNFLKTVKLGGGTAKATI